MVGMVSSDQIIKKLEKEVSVLMEMLYLALLHQGYDQTNDYAAFILNCGRKVNAEDAYEYMFQRCKELAKQGRASDVFLEPKAPRKPELQISLEDVFERLPERPPRKSASSDASDKSIGSHVTMVFEFPADRLEACCDDIQQSELDTPKKSELHKAIESDHAPLPDKVLRSDEEDDDHNVAVANAIKMAEQAIEAMERDSAKLRLIKQREDFLALSALAGKKSLQNYLEKRAMSIDTLEKARVLLGGFEESELELLKKVLDQEVGRLAMKKEAMRLFENLVSCIETEFSEERKSMAIQDTTNHSAWIMRDNMLVSYNKSHADGIKTLTLFMAPKRSEFPIKESSCRRISFYVAENSDGKYVLTASVDIKDLRDTLVTVAMDASMLVEYIDKSMKGRDTSIVSTVMHVSIPVINLYRT